MGSRIAHLGSDAAATSVLTINNIYQDSKNIFSLISSVDSFLAETYKALTTKLILACYG